MSSRFTYFGAAFVFFVAGSVSAAPITPMKLISYEVPFLINMNYGAPDVVVAKNGDLQLIARCEQAGYPSLIGRSNNPFWSSNSQYLDIGGEVVLDSGYFNTGPSFVNPIDDGSVFQYGTHYIGVDSETTGYGVSIFGSDCLFVGKSIIIRNCKLTDWRCISNI